MDGTSSSIHESSVYLRREALEAGVSDAMLAGQRRAGLVHRIRHGAYCAGDLWAAASPEERHLLRAAAVRRTTPGEIAFSHTTALLLHGIPVWNADLSKVHVTRLDGGSKRAEKDVDHHVGALDQLDVMRVGDLDVVTPTRAVIEHAGLSTIESGMVSADAALNRGLATPEALFAIHQKFLHWPGQRKVWVVLHYMDGRSESVGESRGRYLFKRAGLPTPELQFRALDPATGDLLGITDYWWEKARVFGEFDGRVKYERHLRPGETAADAVFREKLREDRIREALDARCFRMGWADLDRPKETGQRLADLLGVLPRWKRAS